MKHYLLYVFYRFYRWSERSGKNAPMIGVIYGITFLCIFNIITILSIAHVLFPKGWDVFDVVGRSLLEYAWRVLLLSGIIYSLLQAGQVRGKAFSESSISRYMACAYSARGIAAYIVASLVLFVFAVWLDSAH